MINTILSYFSSNKSDNKEEYTLNRNEDTLYQDDDFIVNGHKSFLEVEKKNVKKSVNKSIETPTISHSQSFKDGVTVNFYEDRENIAKALKNAEPKKVIEHKKELSKRMITYVKAYKDKDVEVNFFKSEAAIKEMSKEFKSLKAVPRKVKRKKKKPSIFDILNKL